MFMVVVEGADLFEDENLDAIFEAGCDDGSVASAGPVQFVDFDREAPTFPDAVLSAIRDLEGAVPGLRAIRVEPEPLVTQSAIAERTGRSRESVRLLIAGKRGPGGFPAPVDYIDARTRVWQWSDVSRWFERYAGRDPDADVVPQFTAALNGILEARRQLAAMPADLRPPPETVRSLRALLPDPA